MKSSFSIPSRIQRLNTICRALILPSALFAVGLAGCNGPSDRSTMAMTANSGNKITGKTENNASLRPVEAVFAKGLTENQAPDKPCVDYAPAETICLSLRFRDRPKKGIVSAKFYMEDHLIDETKADLATLNGGVVFSIGESTYVGFSLKPNNPFPINAKYRVETFFDGNPIGTYPFKVVPPTDAIPSKITETALAKNVDESSAPVGPTTEFASDQKVWIAMRGDIGSGTGIEVNWYVNGQLDPAGTKSLTAKKNIPDTRFYFSYIPAGGWKPGKNEAVVTMNGNEAGRYSFTTN